MAATQLAVIYATESKILPRELIPDDDEQLRILAVPAGESVFRMWLDRTYDGASCRVAIASVTGVEPSSRRCCIVGEAGHVIGVCNADPALDVHPQGQFVPSDDAGPGNRFVGGVFLRHDRVATNSTITVVAPVSGTVST
jgi:hypothetical protein